MRKVLPYRIGKKVGVFAFNLNKNQDEIKEGKIVARRWHNRIGIDPEYVVKFKDGECAIARTDELWTKWGKTK